MEECLPPSFVDGPKVMALCPSLVIRIKGFLFWPNGGGMRAMLRVMMNSLLRFPD